MIRRQICAQSQLMVVLYLEILDGNFVAGDQRDDQSRESVQKRMNCSLPHCTRHIVPLDYLTCIVNEVERLTII